MDNPKKAAKSIELRHLRYFITVAEEGSFSQAAKQLEMTQPPLSFQMQELEDTLLGVKLFIDRQKRPLQLTPAGTAFLVEAKAILKTIDLATEKTQMIDSGKVGYLTVGFTSALANSVMPDILRKFGEKHPDVQLILSEEDSVTQVQRLRDRLTDVMFLYQYSGANELVIAAKDLTIEPICQESLVVVLPEQHELATKSEILLSDLNDRAFIMPDRQFISGLFREIQNLLNRVNSTPIIVLEAVYVVTILGLVAGGIGVSILPDSVQNLQRKGVVYRPISGQNTMADRLNIVYLKDNKSIHLKDFIDVAHEFINLERSNQE